MVSCLTALMQPFRRAASRAALIAGSSNNTKMAMMAITTKSSTRVKPRLRKRVDIEHTSNKKENDEESRQTPLVPFRN
jgi:hypothetical protein